MNAAHPKSLTSISGWTTVSWLVVSVCCFFAPFLTWACSPLPPGSEQPPLPPAAETARVLYTSPGEYLVVGKILNIKFMPSTNAWRTNYSAEIEILETIRGPGPFRATKIMLRAGDTAACEKGYAPTGAILIFGVNRTETVPNGIWWEFPYHGVLQELERLGKSRNGASTTSTIKLAYLGRRGNVHNY